MLIPILVMVGVALLASKAKKVAEPTNDSTGQFSTTGMAGSVTSPLKPRPNSIFTFTPNKQTPAVAQTLNVALVGMDRANPSAGMVAMTTNTKFGPGLVSQLSEQRILSGGYK